VAPVFWPIPGRIEYRLLNECDKRMNTDIDTVITEIELTTETYKNLRTLEVVYRFIRIYTDSQCMAYFFFGGGGVQPLPLQLTINFYDGWPFYKQKTSDFVPRPPTGYDGKFELYMMKFIRHPGSTDSIVHTRYRWYRLTDRYKYNKTDTMKTNLKKKIKTRIWKLTTHNTIKVTKNIWLQPDQRTHININVQSTYL